MNNNTHGIAHLSIIPCRTMPSNESEMVTQLLFGEGYVVQEKQNNWFRIKILHDGYECWINEKQFFPVNQEQFNSYTEVEKQKILDTSVFVDGDLPQQIVRGSVVPDSEKFQIGTLNFKLGKLTTPVNVSIEKIALSYLHAPYLWGGRSPFGIDCSGFTQMVFLILGIAIPRDSWQQAETGNEVAFVQDTQAGDLAFFDNEEGRITHVGIILETGKIIHASGQVRIDAIDHEGIFNETTRKYSHKLRIIKRII